MKYVIPLILLFLSTMPKLSSAQDVAALKFDKKYIKCENKWIAQANKDSTFTYGFIYIDSQAGLTLDIAGTFIIEKNVFIPTPRENSAIKIRVPVNNNLITIIPNNRLKELKVKEVPDWLQIYKGNLPSAERFYRIGFVFNAWQECDSALKYLEMAKLIDPNFKALSAEFAYAYNALKQYDKAVVVLKKALMEAENDCYLNKELVYAQMNLGLTEDAKASAIKGIAECKDNSIKAEMAYNIAYLYFKLKDKEKFDDWATETTKWIKPEHPLIKSLAELKIKLGELR